jgi:putative two-component system response regulator
MTNATILVVDDNPGNISILSNILRPEYKVKMATSGTKALQIMSSPPLPDMVLLDVMMPEIDGFEVCRRLKDDPLTTHIPVIFVTAKIAIEDETLGLEIGAADYITKPVNPALVRARVKTQLALYDQTRQLAQLVKEKTQELNDTRLTIIQKLGRAAEYKDNETGMHVIRMSHYARIIAQALNANPQWCELLFNAAPMHDIGKIGIVDDILLKPGKLDDRQWLEMKKHPEYGAHILSGDDSQLLKLAREIALSHHEKYDGSGYPKGLQGDDIPLASRIVAIADVFDALTAKRPYKRQWSDEEAVAMIKDNAGNHFDPQIVDAFLANIDKILAVKEEFKG